MRFFSNDFVLAVLRGATEQELAAMRTPLGEDIVKVSPATRARAKELRKEKRKSP